ncbi:MAG: TldD/PmbA family protein [Elusimicrobiota bacterium]
MNIILIALIIFNINFLSAGDVFLDAMKKELNVSYEKLKNAEKFPMYFIGYEAWDSENWWVSSNLGSIKSEMERKQRIISCDIRVGTPDMDSTHEIKGVNYDENSKMTNISILPLNDEQAIRSEIWNLTDKTYKDALNRYIRVLTNKQVTAEEEDKSGDFIIVKTTQSFKKYFEPEIIDKDVIKNMLKKLSSVFKRYDFIIDSSVSFSKEYQNRYIVNSNGSEIVEGERRYRLSYLLVARTDDGMDISRYRNYDFENISEMPLEDKVLSDIYNSIDELKNLLTAKQLEPYTGPAILESKAAAVFWHEIFGHRVEGHRQKSESEGQTFAKKIGQSIMPSFITIYDDPNLKYYNSKFLNGNYLYDDEGVKSQKAVLVENGVLKGFLMQRVPVLGFKDSNGHGRRSPGYLTVARQGNLIVESTKVFPYQTLKKMLIEEIKKSQKPYGLIIKDIEGGFTFTTRDMPQSYTVLIKYAFKIYPDGKEEVVRGLNMIGTPLQTFSRIVATGDDYDVFNGVCGAESGWVNVSAVSPSLLFSEIETEKVQKSNQKPPILKPPYIDLEGK